jgi:NAD(P)-dependent dehydrogenase (short-subunit alcohol dehydrogenase family)
MHEQSVALVTGANKGIGKAVVRELAMRGYTVYLASRDASLGVAIKKTACHFSPRMSERIRCRSWSLAGV